MIWKRIKDRCCRPKDAAYPRYGGRGIRICKRWRDSPKAFFNDMWPRPSPERSIDRKENDGNYSCGKCEECRLNGWPANCRWATKIEQGRNMRSNRIVTIDGVSRCLSEWEEQTGNKQGTIQWRLEAGWDERRAVFEPVVQRGQVSP